MGVTSAVLCDPFSLLERSLAEAVRSADTQSCISFQSIADAIPWLKIMKTEIENLLDISLTYLSFFRL